MSSNNDNIEGQPPPAKRQRRSLGASDRVVLDVGGTKFITSASTLTSNSAYFASLLSDNWIESNNGEDEIFIDQDPVPFKVLLAYMRRGNIKVDDINTDVLSLAEFLGMERLLLAIKVRWYCNIGRGPVCTRDDEIAVAFDQEHGGLMKAISAGLFPHFLKQNDINAEKDYAVLKFGQLASTKKVSLKEIGKPDSEDISLISAMNDLSLKGYTNQESQLETDKSIAFSRRKHVAKRLYSATDIFIPNKEEELDEEQIGYTKQYAVVVDQGHGLCLRLVIAPDEFHRDVGGVIFEEGTWLADNGFVTKEDSLEDVFRNCLSSLISPEEEKIRFNIFSRMIKASRDVSW